MQMYPPLAVEVTTPVLTLKGASDALLAELAAAVHAGEAMAEPAPFDDPMSLYEDDPDLHGQRRLEPHLRVDGLRVNGLAWASRRGSAAQLQRWRITRQAWSANRREDIQLAGVTDCCAALGC